MAKHFASTHLSFWMHVVSLIPFLSPTDSQNTSLLNDHLISWQNSSVPQFSVDQNSQEILRSKELYESAFKFEPIVSDPVVEDISGSDFVLSNLRRDVPDRGFSVELKKSLLDLHNLYRGNVTPPAGDMALMEWDDELEHLAQLWADGCVFAHGTPSEEYSHGAYGQNLYIGPDPTGYKALYLWYEEYKYYDLKEDFCEPNQQCGHYVQLAWSSSSKLGCGITRCEIRYLIVCHYYKPAFKNVQMYDISRPCTQCPDEGGSLCKDNLCVTWDQYERVPEVKENAECKLKCQNCGRLDKEKCRCTCADGWDSPDCSRPCTDKHPKCGKSPGFPSTATCFMNNNPIVAKLYCRKMCSTCNPFEEDKKHNHICCEGRFCKSGYVLDMDRKLCRCTILCPGPECDVLDGGGVLLRNDFTYIALSAVILYFVMCF